ncbi:MAG: hypothetical protein MI922_25680, partial [Bacteroidales bacterium]|nr:hypothetical protein [Bacteroidales bacterium]
YYFNVTTNRLQLISNEVLEIHDLIFDKLGRLWVGAMEGLFLLEGSFETGFTYKQYSHNDILSILPTNDKIWFSTNTGVEYLDINLESKSENTSILDDEYVFDIKLVNKVQLWIATRYSGLLIYDIPRKNIQTFSDYVFKNTGKYSTAAKAKDVRRITTSSSGKIYIGTVGDGLLIYDLNSHELLQYRKSVNKYNISGNTVLCVFEDRDNNLWLGHARKGISVVDNNRDKIKVFYNRTESEDYSSILCVYEDSNGDILYGTDGEGLFKVNNNEEAIRLYPGEALQDAYVQCVFKDSRNNVWIGTFSKGLMVKTPGKRKLNIPIEANDIRGFVEDKHNNIWIATYGLGLFCYNLLDDSYSHYKHSPEDNNSISSNIILNMLLHQGDLYLATYGGGVNVFNTKTRQAYAIKDISVNGKTGANIISMAINNSDDLWVGSSLGITNLKRENNKWNYNSYSFKGLGFKGHLRALIIDDKKKIWFSTDIGIYELNTDDSTIFKVNLGYLNNQAEFHLNSVAKLQNGKLYFGSTSGLFSFHPENVYDSHIKPKMLITGFKTLGKRKEKIIGNDVRRLNKIRQQGKV